MEIKGLTLKDFFVNLYLKYRFYFYRFFQKNKLSNSSPKIKENYNLVFNEEFKTINWDYHGYDKWKIGEVWGMFHPDKPNVHYGPPLLDEAKSEAIFYVNYSPKKFFHPKKEREITIPFEVSLLSSERYFKRKYGRFECRMTLPKEKGTWPAFWMYGKPWPPEIDIIETYGGADGKKNRIQEINIHYDETPNKKSIGAKKIKIDSPKNLGENYYEFAFEWSSEKLEFFTNGVKVFQYTNKEIIKKHLSTEMFIVINHSLQPNNIVTEKDKDYYSEFRVDYVRGYEFF